MSEHSSSKTLVAALRELSKAFVEGRQDSYGMHIPAEPNRDGDIVCARAAEEIERLEAREREAFRLANAIEGIIDDLRAALKNGGDHPRRESSTKSDG